MTERERQPRGAPAYFHPIAALLPLLPPADRDRPSLSFFYRVAQRKAEEAKAAQEKRSADQKSQDAERARAEAAHAARHAQLASFAAMPWEEASASSSEHTRAGSTGDQQPPEIEVDIALSQIGFGGEQPWPTPQAELGRFIDKVVQNQEQAGGTDPTPPIEAGVSQPKMTPPTAVIEATPTPTPMSMSMSTACWVEHVDGRGKKYWCNDATGEMSRRDPFNKELAMKEVVAPQSVVKEIPLQPVMVVSSPERQPTTSLPPPATNHFDQQTAPSYRPLSPLAAAAPSPVEDATGAPPREKEAAKLYFLEQLRIRRVERGEEAPGPSINGGASNGTADSLARVPAAPAGAPVAVTEPAPVPKSERTHQMEARVAAAKKAAADRQLELDQEAEDAKSSLAAKVAQDIQERLQKEREEEELRIHEAASPEREPQQSHLEDQATAQEPAYPMMAAGKKHKAGRPQPVQEQRAAPSEAEARRQRAAAVLNAPANETGGISSYEPDPEVAQWRVEEGIEAKLSEARREADEEAEALRRQREALEASIREREGGKTAPQGSTDKAAAMPPPRGVPSQHQPAPQLPAGFHTMDTAADKVQQARSQADSELESMHKSIMAKTTPTQQTSQRGAASESAEKDSTLFVHRGRMFPFSSPREEASRAKEEQKKSLEEMIGTSLEKARKRRMDMEMEYASAVVRAQQAKEHFETKKLEASKTVDAAFTALSQVAHAELPKLAEITQPTDVLHDICAAAVCVVSMGPVGGEEVSPAVNLEWDHMRSLLGDPETFLNTMRPTPLGAGEYVAGLPKKAIYASRSILDGAKLSPDKISGLPVGALAMLQWAKCAVAFHLKTEELEAKTNSTARQVILSDEDRRRAAEYVSHLLLTT